MITRPAKHLKALERRRDFLTSREHVNSFDKAELAALEWAIVNLQPIEAKDQASTQLERQLAAPLSELPPLPEPCKQVLPTGWVRYTADQMRDYARAAQRAAPTAQPQFCEYCHYDHSVGPLCKQAAIQRQSGAAPTSQSVAKCNECEKKQLQIDILYEEATRYRELSVPTAQGSGKDAERYRTIRSFVTREDDEIDELLAPVLAKVFPVDEDRRPTAEELDAVIDGVMAVLGAAAAPQEAPQPTCGNSHVSPYAEPPSKYGSPELQAKILEAAFGAPQQEPVAIIQALIDSHKRDVGGECDAGCDIVAGMEAARDAVSTISPKVPE